VSRDIDLGLIPAIFFPKLGPLKLIPAI